MEKLRFTEYSKPFKFKRYSEMKSGKNIQIDHISVTKNGVTTKHFAGIKRFS